MHLTAFQLYAVLIVIGAGAIVALLAWMKGDDAK